jgi:hypothetical protein
MIKKYKEFVKEDLELNSDDSIDVSASKNALNKMQQDIKDYNAKRNTLFNIYKNAASEIEISKQLLSNKFISSSDPKNVVFINPLLGMSAEMFKKQRQMDLVNTDLEKIKKDIETEKFNANNNPSTKQYNEENIKLNQDKIQTKTKELENLNKEVANIELQVKQKLSEYQKTIADNINKMKNTTGQ